VLGLARCDFYERTVSYPVPPLSKTVARLERGGLFTAVGAYSEWSDEWLNASTPASVLSHALTDDVAAYAVFAASISSGLLSSSHSSSSLYESQMAGGFPRARKQRLGRRRRRNC
jgi:hypothetical protein